MLDPGETVTVTLSDATTTAGTADVDATAREATTTIMDDGTETVSVAAAAETVPEGTAAQFTVTLSGAVANNVTLNWRTTDDGTATAGEDYTAVMDGTVTFISGGPLAQTISVSTLDDNLAEMNETFTVTLAAPGSGLPEGVGLGTATATGTIADDDPMVASVTVPQTVVEGEAAEFTVTLAGGTSTEPVVVSYTLGGTATAGDDYTAPEEPRELTIAAGTTTVTISIPTLTDSVLDPGETVTVTLSDATTTAGTADVDATAREATTTIMDDGTETVSVAAAAETVPEGTAAQFTVTLSGAVANNVTLNWRTTDDGTATAGEDYTAVMDGTVTFVSGGPLTQTISVTTLQDTLAELDERFTVTLAAPGTGLPEGVSLSPGMDTAIGTIEDDDPMVASVTVPQTVVEGEAAEFTVTLAGGTSTEPVVVSYTLGGTATAGDDYTAPDEPRELTIAAGTTTVTISIPTLTDSVLDPGETLTVTLSEATTTVGTADVDATAREATTTIMDDGTETVSVAAAAETVPEGTAAQFTVTLSGAVANNVTLNWRTTDDGTATAGEDYTAVMDGTVTFVSGESLAQTISVTTLQDTLAELNERFTVTLAAPGSGLPEGVSLSTGMDTATGTIADDDPIVAERDGPPGPWSRVRRPSSPSPWPAAPAPSLWWSATRSAARRPRATTTPPRTSRGS